MTALEEIKAKAKDETDALIEAAYFAGVAAGKQLAKVEILNLLTTDEAVLDNWKKVTAPTQHDIKFNPSAEEVEDARRRVLKRAPKGLTDAVLKKVFEQHPEGLVMEAVQEAAMAIDDRISAKTVYNTLYRETKTYFKDDFGRWQPIPQVRGGSASWVPAQTRQPEGAVQ